MAGLLPNFHVTNSFPPVLLNYYLTNSIFHLCYHRPKWQPGLGGWLAGSVLPWILFVNSLLYSSQSCILFLSWQWWSSILLLWSPWPQILKSFLCLSVQPLASGGNFIYPLESDGVRDPQCLTWRILLQIREPKLQASNQIHNCIKCIWFLL